MLAIEQQKSRRTLTPNILPCTIHHNGPLKISKRCWSPQSASDGTKASYFRGRKLRGRTVKLPAGYGGCLLQNTERQAEPKPVESAPVLDEDGDVMEDRDDVKVMENKASFDEVVVWGHELLPEDGDEYVKGIEEWITFAEAVRRAASHRRA
jgi:ribonuclease H2 subunit C